MYNMPIIMPCIPILRKLLLKYVWGTFLNHLWSFLLEKQVKGIEKMIQIKLKGSLRGSNRYIKQYMNNWRRSKPNTRLGMIDIG
jgi:hypothetical protein